MRQFIPSPIGLVLAGVLWASVLATPAQAQAVFNADPSTLGAIPDSVLCGPDGPPLVVSVPVTGMVGGVTSVAVSMVLSHTWMGEITATLIAPDGTPHVLFGRTRADSPGTINWGSDADLINTAVSFSDAAGGNWWTAAQTNPVPAGAYRTSAIGGFVGATGAVTAINPVFNNREPNGTWLVRFTDSWCLDVGSVSALSISLTTTGIITPPVAAVPDNYVAGRNTPLLIAAPGVLANDINSPGSGPLSATLQSTPTHGTLTLNSNGSFTYVPAAGYLGPDSFSYYASNFGGSTLPATVAIEVVPIQPPVNFRVDRVTGNTVTLRWDPNPVGPPATGYQVEGGVGPGTVQGAVPVGAVPAITFSAPTGAFYVRVRAFDGAMTSGNSNETRLYVNVPVAPSAPARLTGLVNGGELGLSWKLTYAGGEPTDVILDVSGSLSTSLAVGLSESFAFPNVPPGTYTFAVRAQNASGSSTSSAPVTLTFPGACSGVPQAPANYLFYRVGNVVSVLWDPPAAGPAPTAYVLNVTGAYVGPVPVGASRSLSTAVGPGTYNVSVRALNACGAGPATAVQTVVVP